jgi:hypothetical protein
MNFKQSNMGDMLDSEREMVLLGAERFGDYFINASEFNVLLQDFVKSVDPDRFIFAMFLSQIRKHHTLALWSVVRLHHIQGMMDLRQVLEAGSCAAYAIADPTQNSFADIDENGIIDASQDLTKKRYAWLDANFPEKSNAIKTMKGLINASTAHSNIISAHHNFKANETLKGFETPFFDIEDEYLVKTDLWQIGNIALSLMDLFFGVNKGIEAIKFTEDFVPRLKELEVQNQALRAEMMATDRYKRSLEISEKTS